MRTKRTLLAVAASFVAGVAAAQSNSGRFDAAVVLTPGMTLQRGNVFMNGGFQGTLLRHGDVIRTDNWMAGSFDILTSDGTVIGIAPATTIAIDGSRIGFDVFQIVNGSANIMGNVNNGYPMPIEFRRFMPFRFGSVTIFPDPDPWQVPNFAVPRNPDRIVFPIRR